MKRPAIALLLLAACSSQPAPDAPAAAANPQLAPAKPQLAGVDPELAAEIRNVEQMVTADPSNLPYTYVLAHYYDQARDAAAVARWLQTIDAAGWDLGLRQDWFQNTAADPLVAPLAARLQAREPRVSRATEAFRMPKERNVRSEGIAWDPVDGVFYFSGGAAKMLRVERGGAIQEVAIEPVGQKFGRLGLDIDAERRQLWAVSAVIDPAAPAEEKGRSGISVYDARDGRLLRRVMRGSAAEPAFFNDITLLRDGTAFITDTGRNEVMRLDPGAETFTPFAAGFDSPNGIAVSADERTLYVADFRGIDAIDLATKKRGLIASSVRLNGIDGLVEHKGTLIGIQNVLGSPRVLRVHLGEGGRTEVLESKNPLMNVPTTGVVAGDAYYFIANLSEKGVDRVVVRIVL